MDSFGHILKKAREEQNISVEQAVKDTAISPRYISALETEQIGVFSSETYAVGFLRNYAEYLGLDAANVIALFRAKQIQEAPPPPELTKPFRPGYLVPLVIGIALVLSAGIGCALFFLIRTRNAPPQGRPGITEAPRSAEYTLSAAEPLSRRLYRGDVILAAGPDGETKLTVGDTFNSLSLISPAGELFVELGEEIALDIDGKPGEDIIVFVSDVARPDESRGAEARIMVAGAEALPPRPPETEPEPLPASASGRTIVILEDNRTYPFVINANFRSACLFRRQIDRNARVDTHYTAGQTLTMQANDIIRLWISNDSAVKMQLSADGKNYDLDVSRLGRIVVCDVRWTRAGAGQYRLVVSELD